MTKVYIITSGIHDDYSIDRVFLDKEKAEKYIETSWDKSIKVYDTDDDKEINEISYVEGEYIKNSSVGDVKPVVWIEPSYTNTLDITIDEAKSNSFHKYDYNKQTLTVKQVLIGNFDEEEIISKYEKLLYDLMAKIEGFMSKGWTEEMVQEWLGQNIEEYINN